MTFLIVLASNLLALLVGVISTRYRNQKTIKHLEALLKKEGDKGWKAGWDSGWESASTSVTNVIANYERIFGKKTE